MKKIYLIDLSPSEGNALKDTASLRAGRDGTLPYDLYEFRDAPGGGVGGPIPSADAPLQADDRTECFLSLPLGWLDFRILTLPFGDTRKLREVIPYELDNLILGGSAQVVFDVAAVTPSSGGSFDVLVAFIRKDILRTVLAFLGARGMDPRVITSLDLRAMLQSDEGSLAERLIAPPQLTQDEKVETAKKEIAAPTIDLRQGELRYTRDTRKKAKHLRVTALLLIVLAVVLHAYLAAEIVLGKRQIAAARLTAQRTYASLFPSQRTVTDEVYQMKAQVKAVKDRAEAFTGADPLDVLLVMSRTTPKGVQINELVATRDLVTIKAEASSAAESDRLKQALSGSYAAVEVSEAKPLSHGKVLFTVTARGAR